MIILYHILHVGAAVVIFKWGHQGKSRRQENEVGRSDEAYSWCWEIVDQSNYNLFYTYVTWFAIRDDFWQNICDLICEKGPLLKHLKNSFFPHTFDIYRQLFVVTVCIQNSY